MKQENEKTELQKRIAAELREKQIRNSLAGDDPKNPAGEDFNVENSAFLEGTKETTGLAFVWFLLFIAILIAVALFVAFIK